MELNRWMIEFENKIEFDIICDIAQNRNFKWKYFKTLKVLKERKTNITQGYLYFEITNELIKGKQKLLSLRSREDTTKFTERMILEKFIESDLGL